MDLTGNRGLFALVLTGAVGYLTGQVGSGMAGCSWDLGILSAGLGLFLLTAFWHELGHAAALAREGYPPGGIGAGVLFVIPVLFADVTAVGALSRTGRIRVDLSGVIFQLSAGGAFFALGACGRLPPFLSAALTLAGSSALLAITWSLLPLLRSDGFWFLCDLLGLKDLDRPPAKPSGRGLRLFLAGLQLTNAIFLLFIGVLLPWKAGSWLLALVPRLGISLGPEARNWLGPFLGLVCLGMVGVGLARRVHTLLRAAWITLRLP
jgi:putative peptide zinc metalloprotease protein